MFGKYHQKESEPLLPKHARVHTDVLSRVGARTRRPGHDHEKEHCRRPDCPQCGESKMRQIHSEVIRVKDSNSGVIPDIQTPRSGIPTLSVPHRSVQPTLSQQHHSHTSKPHSAPVSKGFHIPNISPALPHPPAHVTIGGQLLHQPVWIPDTRSPAECNRPRTLVLCFDASSDQLDVGVRETTSLSEIILTKNLMQDSNIIQFLSFLMKDDKNSQVVYYQTGSISSTVSGPINTVKNQISKTVDSMFAPNLASDVQDGYRFLVQNCEQNLEQLIASILTAIILVRHCRRSYIDIWIFSRCIHCPSACRHVATGGSCPYR